MIARGRVEADDAFILDSWMRSFRESNESGPYPPALYFPAARGTITALLERSGVQTIVLGEDHPSDVIIGYIVHEPTWARWSRRNRCLEQFHVVHYLFVREGEPDARVRGRGFARYLLEAAAVRRESTTTAFSFATRAARGLMGDAPRFIPDAARYASRTTQGAEQP